MALTRIWGKATMGEQGADGADGNARLTGAIGLLLLVVLFVEGITILQVRQLITVHIFVGLVLVPLTAIPHNPAATIRATPGRRSHRTGDRTALRNTTTPPDRRIDRCDRKQGGAQRESGVSPHVSGGAP